MIYKQQKEGWKIKELIINRFRRVGKYEAFHRNIWNWYIRNHFHYNRSCFSQFCTLSFVFIGGSQNNVYYFRETAW